MGKKLKQKTKVLKKREKQAIEKLLKRKLPKYEIISTDIASELAELAVDTGEIISLLIDRNGKIRDYYLGELRSLDIKAQVAREKINTLGQLRLITANPREDSPSESDLLVMRKYNLDVLLFINSNKSSEYSRSKGNYLPFANYGIVSYLSSNAERWTVNSKQTLHEIENIDFEELIIDIEEDIAQINNTLKVKTQQHAILVGFQDEESFSELSRLADTAGAKVVYELKQNIKKPDSKFFIGSGKVQELGLYVEKYQADIIIFNGELSPAQARNIERELSNSSIKVLDRTELILDIFAQRARTKEGKLQVELAQLRYLAPRLAGGYQALSKIGGGLGNRGLGETKLELDRRKIDDKIAQLSQKVQEVQKTRGIQRKNRESSNLPLVSLVGYTNAGKSTLFRTLTNADVLVEDKLFATLDPTLRQVNNIPEFPFILSDTVGFIQDLPTTLVKAFKATLEEILEADLLLIVLDASHPSRANHLSVINNILEQLGADNRKQLLVFNKTDLVSQEELNKLKEKYTERVFISAETKNGLDKLLNKIQELIT